MGTPKAFLPWGSETFLDHALKLAGTVAGQLRVVGDREQFAKYAAIVVEDVYSNRGPLGGIHAALSSTTSELNLMLAVDMPFLKAEFLGYLIAQARQCGAVVTVPNAAGNFQPLCAVYRPSFAQVAEESLQAGKNKIDPLFSKVITRVVEEKDLLRAGFFPEMFRNVNTPEDLELARRFSVSEASRFGD